MYRLNSIIRKSNTPQKLFIRSLTDAAGNELKLPVSFEDVSRAYHRIRDGIKRTVNLYCNCISYVFYLLPPHNLSALRQESISQRAMRHDSISQERVHTIHW